jgi:hypothetical protein
MDPDLPVRELVRETQNYRSAAFRTELLQHYPEPRDSLCRVEVRIECRQGLEQPLLRGIVYVDAACLPMFEHRVLLNEIIRDCVEVKDGIANCPLVLDSQHSHVDLLREVWCVVLAPDAPPEECLQSRPVVGKQPLDQGWFRVIHGYRDAS